MTFMKLRSVIFWPHLVAGVIAGTIILIMSITGVLLTYERQLIAWSDRHLRSSPPAPDAARLPVEGLLVTVRDRHPEIVATAVTIGSSPDATAVFATASGNVHVDTYTGRLLGQSATGIRSFMSGVRAWHRWLAVDGDGRPLARAITGWANVLFLFIVVSGAYLWLPRTWTWLNVRRAALFTGGLRGKPRDFNWHHVVGVWSGVPLFIVVLSAVPISFPWGTALVYRAVGEQPPARSAPEGPLASGRGGSGRQGDLQRAGDTKPVPGVQTPQRRNGHHDQNGRRDDVAVSFAGLNELWARAERHVPGWRSINMRLPQSDRAPVVFAIDRGNGGQPHLRSTLTLDRSSRDIVSDESFSSLTLGRRIRNVMRFAHTGEVLGIPGQTIAGLATFGAVVLVWTGIALALRRCRAWMRRRPALPAVEDRETTAA